MVRSETYSWWMGVSGRRVASNGMSRKNSACLKKTNTKRHGMGTKMSLSPDTTSTRNLAWTRVSKIGNMHNTRNYNITTTPHVLVYVYEIFAFEKSSSGCADLNFSSACIKR